MTKELYRYNRDKGQLVQQPTWDKPTDANSYYRHLCEFDFEAAQKYETDYKEYIASLKSFDTLFTEWGDGDLERDVHFKIETDAHPDWVPTYNNPDDPSVVFFAVPISAQVDKQVEEEDEDDERIEDKRILDRAKASAFIMNWFDKWCEGTKRSGGVLITKSIRELLTDFYNDVAPATPNNPPEVKSLPVEGEDNQNEDDSIQDLCTEAKELVLKILPTDEYGEDGDVERLYNILEELPDAKWFESKVTQPATEAKEDGAMVEHPRMMAAVYWNNAQIMTMEEFIKWFKQ